MPILVSISATETTEDNTGGIEGEDVDDAEERKLNYFWQMPHMENDHTDSLLTKGKDPKGKAVSATVHTGKILFGLAMTIACLAFHF